MFGNAKLLLNLIFLLLVQFSEAQVENKAYGLMLNKLLKHSVPEISVDSLAKTKDNFILLDSREKDEYEVSRIPNAIHVGYNKFNTKTLNGIAKDEKIVVYCSVGARSENITEKLLKMGYSDVANLYGGIFEWKNRGNAVVNSQGETENVHAYDKFWGIWLKKGNRVYE